MKNLSKFMSLILRHKPDEVGVTLDSEGWVDVQELVKGICTQPNYRRCTLTHVEEIVRKDSKQRYTIKDGKIRANQGHSIKVNLGLIPEHPPEELFHGTPLKFVDVILEEGLKPMQRQYVHLSSDRATAIQVANRRGKEHIFVIDATKMVKDGFKFYKSENGVWLTYHVPTEYLY